MAEIKKYLSLDKLGKYDVKIKGVISAGDEATLGAAKEYADGLATNYEPAGSIATAKSELEGKIEAAAAAAQTADGKAVAAQNDVDALELLVGTLPEGSSVNSVVAYIDKKTEGIASEGAMTELSGRVSVVEGKVSTIEGDYLKAADKTELEGKITAEENRAKGIEGGLETRLAAVEGDYLKAADKTELQGNIDTVSGVVNTLVGTDTSKSVRTIANEELAAQLIAENAAESLDTLQEIAAWIQSHPGDASAMNKAIEDLETLVGTLPEGVTATTIVAYIQEAVAAEKSRAEGIEGGLETRLAAVEGAVGTEGSVKDMIDAAVAAEAALRVSGDQAAEASAAGALAAAQAAQGEVDALEGVVATLTETVNGKAAQSDLTALTTRVTTAEGEIDTLQGEMTQAQADIDAVEAKAAGNETAIAGLQTAVDTKAAQADLQAEIDRAKAAEEANAAAIAAFVEISEEEINALFA
jgi:hypothetical protein